MASGLAGGKLFSEDRIPAKPRWSEVIVFLGILLRQTTPSPELARRYRSPHQFTESVSNRGGL
ncbi:hypothetical protein B5G93_15545, partial [Listeria monocytogenes]|nr:hypothetical protein [Listeria monocytogenes]